MNLTDEEVRIKVAEAMGWNKIYKGPEPDNRWMSPCGRYRALEEIPNYPKSLDACAEFEGSNWQNHKAYIRNLIDICQTPEDAITATARQRCLAYLKTKGLIP